MATEQPDMTHQTKGIDRPTPNQIKASAHTLFQFYAASEFTNAERYLETLRSCGVSDTTIHRIRMLAEKAYRQEV